MLLVPKPLPFVQAFPVTAWISTEVLLSWVWLQTCALSACLLTGVRPAWMLLRAISWGGAVGVAWRQPKVISSWWTRWSGLVSAGRIPACCCPSPMWEPGVTLFIYGSWPMVSMPVGPAVSDSPRDVSGHRTVERGSTDVGHIIWQY